jgi:hypothetical protein
MVFKTWPTRRGLSDAIDEILSHGTSFRLLVSRGSVVTAVRPGEHFFERESHQLLGGIEHREADG